MLKGIGGKIGLATLKFTSAESSRANGYAKCFHGSQLWILVSVELYNTQVDKQFIHYVNINHIALAPLMFNWTENCIQVLSFGSLLTCASTDVLSNFFFFLNILNN